MAVKRTRTLLLLLCTATLLCNPGYLQWGDKNGCLQEQTGKAKSVRSRYAILQAEGDVHLEGDGIVLSPGTAGNGLHHHYHTTSVSCCQGTGLGY